MIRLSEVRNALKTLDFHPSRQLGQNFLIDRNILDIMLGQLELEADDAVLEIGPGLGAATEVLLHAGHRVTAVEKDWKLAGRLDKVLGDNCLFELIRADFLDVDCASLLSMREIKKVFSNLPYSVGTRILINLVFLEQPPERIVVTLQSEVAKRVAAEPSTGPRSVLSAWVQSVYDVAVVKKISSSCFWPRPEVESSVIRLDLNPMEFTGKDEKKFFVALTKRAFMHKRKQIGKILRAIHGEPDITGAETMLAECGISSRLRPGNLTNGQWLCLTRKLMRLQCNC